MKKLAQLGIKFAYSFPVQLLLNNFKRNIMLMLCWILLFAMMTGRFGKYLGISYLFLYPEYLNKVNFISFFWVGFSLAGFTMAFHITCYITDGYRFSFVGTLSKPFAKFIINNYIIPVLFLITYIYQLVAFQISNEHCSYLDLTYRIGGFLVGFLTMTLFFSVYFRFTNKDIFKLLVSQIDKKIKTNVPLTRGNVIKKLLIIKKKQVRVDHYIDSNLQIKPVKDVHFYDKTTVLQVFDQNHLNLLIIELFIFVVILVLGIFKDYPLFQLPAAASCIIFLTISVMVFGAFSYWFGGWSTTVGIITFFIINQLVGENFFSKIYQAYGLNYEINAKPYNPTTIKAHVDKKSIEIDKSATLQQLQKWRVKLGTKKKPKMVFICVSGGGKRAALWTLNALQQSDSVTHGQLMNNTILITGASGGLIGASYFRELKLRQALGQPIQPYSPTHRKRISSDNLNPLIFSLLANDLFTGFTKFSYHKLQYQKDRAYTFENQLNQITEGLMDRPIVEYNQYEIAGIIPTIILSPSVVNDGRKIYIAARPVSFMNEELLQFNNYENPKVSGVDFLRFFKEQGSENLRFLSALRMSATFPYITPNTTLPTQPPIQMMDAGIADNFGVSDAVRFLYAFKNWIDENTDGVIFVCIRDSPKAQNITKNSGETILNSITQPISYVYNNFENFQDITGDLLLGQACSWLQKPIYRVDIQYQTEYDSEQLQESDSIKQNNVRASLSWRLTTREKENIVENIHSINNKLEIQKLKTLLSN